MSRFQLEFSVHLKPYFILLKYSLTDLRGIKNLNNIIMFCFAPRINLFTKLKYVCLLGIARDIEDVHELFCSIASFVTLKKTKFFFALDFSGGCGKSLYIFRCGSMLDASSGKPVVVVAIYKGV